MAELYFAQAFRRYGTLAQPSNTPKNAWYVLKALRILHPIAQDMMPVEFIHPI